MSRLNSPSERFLGYDLRTNQDEWGYPRREQFLLRTEVTRPLAADISVWPAPLRANNSTNLVSDWVLLIAEYLRNGATNTSPVILSVTIHDSNSDHRYDLPRNDEMWAFLGYDVGDSCMVSGLSNCGYNQLSVMQLRERWNRFINAHHLFDQIDLALEFAEMSNHRVPEHAPFFVYGLYRVQGTHRVD